MDNVEDILLYIVMCGVLLTILHNTTQIRKEIKEPKQVNITVCHEYLSTGSRVIHCPNIEEIGK